jgi:hypothetical protein
MCGGDWSVCGCQGMVNRWAADRQEAAGECWTASDDGRQLYGDDFEHDVMLKIDGDFESDDERKAYARALATQLNANHTTAVEDGAIPISLLQAAMEYGVVFNHGDGRSTKDPAILAMRRDASKKLRAAVAALAARAQPATTPPDAGVREALAELVALKDMKERLERLHEMGMGTDYTDYHRRKPLAWAAARAALAAQPAATPPDAGVREALFEQTLRQIVQSPRIENSVRGKRLRCPVCLFPWKPGDKPHHASDCASEIARAALAAQATPPAEVEVAQAARGFEITPATLSKAIGCKALSIMQTISPPPTLNQALSADDVAQVLAALNPGTQAAPKEGGQQ